MENVLGNPVVLVEEVVKRATLAGVVALRTNVLLFSFLSAQNQDGSSIRFHHR
jgi:hypothetical protein